MDQVSTIDEYIAKLTKEERAELQRLMKIIRQEVPEAEESISYGMPAFKFSGKPLIYLGVFKDHLSIFPTSGPVAELEAELHKYTTGKGTLQYKLEEPFPEELLIELLKTRIKQIS